MNDASRNVPRPVAWAALAALTLILAGCGVHYDFVIHDNETADLTYIMWDSSDLHLITKETCTEKDLGKSSPLPEGVEATYTYTSHNSNPACQVTAKAVPLSKLQTDTWTIKHKDGQYIFDLSPGSLSKLGSKNPQLPSQNIGGSTKVAVSVTFPGEVTKSNGKSEGNKVTWDNALESSDSLHAEGEDGRFHLRWWMVAIASGIVLLIIVGVVIYLLRVRRAQQQAHLPRFHQQVDALEHLFPLAPSRQSPAPDGRHGFSSRPINLSGCPSAKPLKTTIRPEEVTREEIANHRRQRERASRETGPATSPRAGSPWFRHGPLLRRSPAQPA